jgi:hypothetical protein
MYANLVLSNISRFCHFTEDIKLLEFDANNCLAQLSEAFRDPGGLIVLECSTRLP